MNIVLRYKLTMFVLYVFRPASSPCVASPCGLLRESWWNIEAGSDGDLGLLKSRQPLRGFGLKQSLAYPWQGCPRHEEKGTRWHPDQLYYHSLGTNKLGLVSTALIKGREKGGIHWEIKTHWIIWSATTVQQPPIQPSLRFELFKSDKISIQPDCTQ